MNTTPWKSGNNGTSRNRWFVLRYLDGEGSRMETYNDRRGNVRRYASREAANKIAQKLNA